jgi:uncharacterized protein with FMN-binding domain
MKKALLSGFVILCFALYSFHQRHDGSGLVVRPPVATPAQSTPSSTNNSGSVSTNNSGSSSTSSATYKDGRYTGTTADAFYGYVQVLAIISSGRLTDVQFLQHPSDNPNSVAINDQAMPYLKQEAVQAQSANVNIISGATDTSQAFIESLSSALRQARS